ncbi:MAG: sacsin N-terminal ATP-binding-like domain-containing protein [Aureispira sp.]
MQIKNIQQFRTNWRNKQGYDMPNWDENFIGSSHEQNSGFYKMVNGIVGNIRADLTPKLQNAQDEQAIYEFLQNAADSHSTECAVVYNDTFFMVINNGKAFTEKDLKALLNSFQGTKADKSKEENCGKIGRYGIGFKLAYRLMGKSDGAEELLRDLAGPLLFSWHNKEQFNTLLEYEGGALGLEDAIGADTAPWLLKIILACFPTAPEETVKDLDYEDQTLFKAEELQELVGFLKEQKGLLEQFSLEQGSLFFLRFGPKKHEKLKASLLNIQSGIGYAMNNLKTLEKVALQDKVIAQHDTFLERYAILPGTDDFKRIDPEFPNCPIEISLGFPMEKEQMQALKKAPSLYQFFPMRNERHGMAYFVHSSSFAKITDRTRLDDQGEANVETFQYITKALKRNLDRYKQDDKERYGQLYRALLLTDRSTEYDASLINKYLYEPLLDYIRENIPTNKGNFYSKDIIIAKDTALPIEPLELGMAKEWFYWTDVEGDKDLLKAASNSAKLDLKKLGLKELILEAKINLLNSRIQQLGEADYQQFVEELKQVEFDDAFAERFAELKGFKFSNNQGDASFYALNDLQEQEDIFLMSDRLLPIKSAIKGLGFSVLEFDVSDYAVILQSLKSQLAYLTKDKALFEKLTARLERASLSPAQKQELLAFFQELDGISNQQVRSIPILSNQTGVAVGLNALLAPTLEVENWLEAYKIQSEEDAPTLEEQYISERDNWEIYSHIILPFWADIVEQVDTAEGLTDFYEQVLYYYSLKSSQAKLDEAVYIYTNEEEGFLRPDQVFYHSCLEQLEVDYEALSSAVQKVMGKPLPHQQVLPYLGKDPFKTSLSTNSKDWKKALGTVLEQCQEADLSAAEKKALFALFTEILSTKDRSKLALFSNQRGERVTLEQLLPAQAEVPVWLKGYRIVEEEAAENLQAEMATAATIYNQLIVPHWANMTEQQQVHSNIKAFYEGVLDYASQAKSPKLLMTGKYVFVNPTVGFVGSGDVFYKDVMEGEEESYDALTKALHALTERHAPHPAVLPFLKERIFKTRNTGLAKTLQSEPALLEKKEAASLVDFMEGTKEDIFTFLYITHSEENARLYEAGKRAKNVPYAVEKGQQDLAEKINALFGTHYKRLPSKLYRPAYKNKGLLRGSALFDTITKSKDAPPELLSALIVESGNADIQEQVFSKIDQIVLREGTTYGKDSFEHQTLQIFRNKEADHSKVRSKIYIENEAGDQWKLDEIAFDPNLTIAINQFGKFSLELAAVVPIYKEYQTLLANIAGQLVDYEAPTVLQKRCFENEEKPLEEVYNALKKQEEHTLENAQQVAFIVLYARLQDSGKLVQGFEVHTEAATVTPITTYDAWHTQSQAFIQAEATLSKEHYGALETLLKLSNKNSAFDFGEQAIVQQPYIDKQTFYCAPIREVEEAAQEEMQQQLLAFLYDTWAALPDAERPMRLELSTNTNNSLAGFAPQGLVSEEAYALEQEQLPIWLDNWVAEDTTEEVPLLQEEEEEGESITVAVSKSRLALLEALGVNTMESTLVAVRRYLKAEEGDIISQKQLNDLRNVGQQHLLHTVEWLAEQKVRFSSEDERLYWLRKLYNTLSGGAEHLPLPVIESVQGAAESPTLEYQLQTVEDGQIYSVDQKQQGQLWSKYEIGMADVLECLDTAGDYYTNVDLKGIKLPTTKINHQLDQIALEEESQEWGAPHYLAWKEQVPYSIFLYDGEMPYTVEFLNQLVKAYQSGHAVLVGEQVYVNKNTDNIEEALFEISKSTGLTESQLVQLLRLKNGHQASPQEHVLLEKVAPVEEPEEAIDNPSLEEIKTYQAKKVKGTLKVELDLSTLPEDKLQELLQYAQSTQMIVEKELIAEEEAIELMFSDEEE